MGQVLSKDPFQIIHKAKPFFSSTKKTKDAVTSSEADNASSTGRKVSTHDDVSHVQPPIHAHTLDLNSEENSPFEFIHKRWEQLTNNLSPLRPFRYSESEDPNDSDSPEEEVETLTSFTAANKVTNKQAVSYHFRLRERLLNLSPIRPSIGYERENAEDDFSLANTEEEVFTSKSTENVDSPLGQHGTEQERLPNLRRRGFRNPTLVSGSQQHRDKQFLKGENFRNPMLSNGRKPLEIHPIEELNEEILKLHRDHDSLEVGFDQPSISAPQNPILGKGTKLSPAQTGGVGSGILFFLVMVVIGFWYFRTAARKRREWWKKMSRGDGGNVVLDIGGFNERGMEWDEDAGAVSLSGFEVEGGLGRYGDREVRVVL